MCYVKIMDLRNNKPEFQSMILVFIINEVLRKSLYLTNTKFPSATKWHNSQLVISVVVRNHVTHANCLS